MNENKNIKVYTPADIHRYINRQMSESEMHEIEKAALEDPFLADAIEGYSIDEENHTGKWERDVKELHERLDRKLSSGKLIGIHRNGWWRVAAILILLSGSAGLIYNFLLSPSASDRKLAKNNSIEKISVKVPDTIQQITIPGKDSLVQVNSPSAKQAHEKPSDSKVSSNEAPIQPPTTSLPEKRNILTDPTTETSASDGNPNYRNQTLRRSPEPAVNENIVSAPMNLPAGNARNHFSGKVLSANYKPVVGASVTANNKEVSTVTDANGNFIIILPDSTATVEVQSLGFEPASATLKNNLSGNRIVLKQSNMALDKAATNDYSSMIKTNTSTPSNSPGITITGGEPIIGIKAYEDYIQKNKKMNGEDSMVQGEVVVSFIINQNGLLSDFTVEKPLTTGINEEAIRLIRKGPGWKIPKGKNGNEKVIIPPKTWITIPF